MLKRVRGWFTNNLFYKIISIVFAFVIWIVIVNIIDPDTSKTIYDIPVVIQNEDAVLDGSHIYQIKSGQTSSITISGARSVVNSLEADDFSATADFSEMSITGAVPITVSLTSANLRYSSKISITVNISSMVLDVENISETVRMVELDYVGTLPSDTIIDAVTIEPESITITAPESSLPEISRVAAKIDLPQIFTSGYVYAEPIIYDGNGDVIENETVTSDSDTVAVYVEVSYTKQVPLVFTVGGEPDSGYEVTDVNSSAEYVTIKGSQEALDQISELEIGAEVLDVTGRKTSLSSTIDLITYLPDDVELYGESSTVTVRVTIVESESESA